MQNNIEIIIIAKDEYGNTIEAVANSWHQAKIELNLLQLKGQKKFETLKQMVDRWEEMTDEGIPININKEAKTI